jgi:tetratricopeptide (TPR) repeat protein
VAIGAFAACIDLCRQCISVDRNYSPAYVQWARALLSLGQHSEAEQKYKSAIQSDRKSAEAIVGLAKLLHLIGRFKEANIEYGIAHNLDPTNPYIPLHWAETLMELCLYEEAQRKRKLADRLNVRPRRSRWIR